MGRGESNPACRSPASAGRPLPVFPGCLAVLPTNRNCPFHLVEARFIASPICDSLLALAPVAVHQPLARAATPRMSALADMPLVSGTSRRPLPVFPGCHPRPCYPLIFPFTLTFPKSSCPDIPLIVMPPPLIVQSQSYGQLPTYPLIRSFTCVNVQFQNSQRHTLPSVAVNITAHTSFLLIVVSIISHILFVNTPL